MTDWTTTDFPNTVNVGALSIAGTAVAGTAQALTAGSVTIDDTGITISGGGTISNAELAMLDGAVTGTGAVLVHDGAAGAAVAHGVGTVTGAGTITTGLTGTIDGCVASLRGASTAVGQPYIVTCAPGAAGKVVVTVGAYGGTAATAAGTVDWIAFGTAV